MTLNKIEGEKKITWDKGLAVFGVVLVLIIGYDT